MAKIYFDYDRVSNQLLSDVQDAKKKVENANNKFNSINIPSGFKYADSLKKVKNKVSSLNNDVSDLEKWIDNSLNKYRKLSDDIDSEVSKLTVFEIETRDNLVS